MNPTLCSQSYNISDREFQLFRNIIFRETGIHMSDRKRNMIVARLSKRLRALNLSSFSDYYHYLNESSDAGNELINLINRITTNKTDFFRERHHFEFLLSEALPTIMEGARSGREKRLRIWSAGCSSGRSPTALP